MKMITCFPVCPGQSEGAQDKVKMLITCLPVCTGRSEGVHYSFTCLPRMKLKQPRGSWTSTKTCWRHATRTSPPLPRNSERYRRSPALRSSRFRSCSTKWPKFKRTRRMPLDRLGNAWGGSIYLFSWSRTAAACILWFEIEVSFCSRSFSEPWSWKWSEQTASLEITLFNFYLRSLFWLRHFYNDLFVLFSCQICLFVCPFLIFIWDRYSHWDIFIMICLSYSFVRFACLCVLFFLSFFFFHYWYLWFLVNSVNTFK